MTIANLRRSNLGNGAALFRAADWATGDTSVGTVGNLRYGELFLQPKEYIVGRRRTDDHHVSGTNNTDGIRSVHPIRIGQARVCLQDITPGWPRPGQR